MARLQKKKTSVNRNKKKTGGLANENNGKIAEKQIAEQSASLHNFGRKQSALQQRSSLSVTISSKGKLKGYWNKSIQFLREVKAEFKKITWPSRKQTGGLTLVVVVLVLLVSFFLGVVDYGLSNLIRILLQ